MIDIIFAALLIIAIVKGLRKGLVVAIFSIIAYIIGIAAALKLSAVVAVHLQKNITVSGKWLPFLSFALVFLVVVILVNWGGKLIEKTFEMAFLGWANRLAGVALYLILYIIIFSVFLFYAEKINLFEPLTIQQSVTYPYIRPWAPKVIAGFGSIVPLFKDSFSQLEMFFQSLSDKIPQ
jgi:membrane protein required for colicin V production